MRNAFAAEILERASEDPRVVLLSGDIGNRLFDGYTAKFPKRFLNCGVAEADMIGVAAGMALSGLKPVAYTINSFIATRCYEQIRIDVCCQNLPVVIVGVGGGLAYASNGPTHHSLEDLAIMRALPNMTVLCPGDAAEVRLALREALRLKGPVFMRIGKKGEPVVHKTQPDFKIGRALVVKPGSAVCLLSAGNMLPAAVAAAEKLDAGGFSCEVASFHTVKPLDEEYLRKVFSGFQVVATVEEHGRAGGLGGAVAEWLCDQPPMRARLLRIGTGDYFLHEAGDQDYARGRFGLTPEAIVGQVAQAARK